MQSPKLFLICTVATMVSCAPVSQIPTDSSPPQTTSTPVNIVEVESSTPQNSATTTSKDRKLLLIIRGDESLKDFQIQQASGICLKDIQSINTNIKLKSGTRSERILIPSITTLIEGIRLELNNLPEEVFELSSVLENADGNALGELNYSVDIQRDRVEVILRALPERDSSACPVLTAEIVGATLTSTRGGLRLPSQVNDKPEEPPSQPSIAPSAIPTPSVTPSLEPVTPMPPSNVQVVARSTSTLTLAWDFQEQKPHSYSVFLNGVERASGLTKPNYTLDGLDANRSYDIEIVSVRNGVKSEAQRVSSSTTSAGRTATGNFSGGGSSSVAPQNQDQTQQEVPAPTLTQLTPNTGLVGSTVTLTGTNFSTTANENTVKFGNETATVTNATENSISAIVPNLIAGATQVTVTVGNQSSASLAFTVQSPPVLVENTNLGFGVGHVIFDIQFVAVGANGMAAISSDGVNWTSKDTGAGNSLRSVSRGPGGFYAVGDDSTVFMTHDLTIIYSIANVTPQDIFGSVIVGDEWFAIGTEAEIYSINNLSPVPGKTWKTDAVNIPPSGLRDIIKDFVGSNLAIATGGSGAFQRIVKILGAGNYTVVDIGAVGMAALSQNGNQYVGVGLSKIYTSPDAETWTERTSNTTQTLRDVTFGNNKFIAVGDNGTVLTSTDGITWKTENSGTTENLRHVVYGDNKFVVTTSSGKVFTSQNL